MRKYFPTYEGAVSHIWLCNCSILNFLTYEENIIFFLSVWWIFSCYLLQASGQCGRPLCRLRRWWRPQAAWSPGREGTAPASDPASVPIKGNILGSNHSQCKKPIQKFKTNITRKGNVCGPILGIYKSLTDTWMWKVELRPCNSPEKGIHKWDFPCSAED